MPLTPDNRPSTEDPLLFLRSIAFLLVFLGHSFQIIFPLPYLKASVAAGHPLWLLTASPWAGLWLFFILSGYLIGKGFYAGRYGFSFTSIADFYRNRLLRIVPVYLFWIFLVAVLVHPEIFRRENLWVLVHILLFDYNAHFPVYVIGALWSIGTEMEFYALAPFLGLVLFALGKKKLPTFLIALALLLAGGYFRLSVFADGRALYGVGEGHHALDYFTSYYYMPLAANLDLFLFGMALNPLVAALRPLLGRARLGATGLAIAIFIYGLASFTSAQAIQFDSVFFQYAYMLLPSLMALLAGIAIIFLELAREHGEFTRRTLSGFIVRRTQFIGKLTYCLYVTHEPIALSLKSVLPVPQTTLQSCLDTAAVSAAIVCASVMTYYLVELPFDRMRSRRLF